MARARGVDEHVGEAAVSVVVTALQDSPALAACLERVRRQCAEIGAELLLVVNRSEQAFDRGIRASFEARADRVLFEPTPGKSHALNRAAREACGSVLAFTDDDAHPGTGWLRFLVAPLLDPERPESLYGSGGPVLPIYPPGGPPTWYRRLVARTDSIFLGPFHFLGNGERDYRVPLGASPLPMGANCAFRREVLELFRYPEDLGPNHETGLRGGEDSVMALRLLRAGLAIRYVPRARIYHPVSPQRMEIEYVREGHRIQGIEYPRICRAVGMPLEDPDRQERHARRTRGGPLRRWLRGADRQLRRSLRAEFLRSQANALRALRDQSPRSAAIASPARQPSSRSPSKPSPPTGARSSA